MTVDPTERFSDRVANYVRYRPSYPDAAIDHLCARCGLRAGAVVVDLGAGTGLSAEPFLRRGLSVRGVEPNANMRAAGLEYLARFPGYVAHDGTAERTGLPDQSADLILAAQAFHWFDAAAAGAEARRIGRTGAFGALIWNSRRLDGSPFLSAYERLLRDVSDDYARVNHQDNVSDERVAAFFGGPAERALFDHAQLFDRAGLIGRSLSASYFPGPDHPRHAEALARLGELFDRWAENGRVTYLYETEVFLRRL